MPYLEARGVRFHYQQAGEGPDVVLLHAVTGNIAEWHFSGLLAALARQWRVTAYDLRGHGLTETTPSGYTSAAMADDFAAIHEALRLGPALVVGHSFGAVVAAHAAVQYPERVAGLILCDAYFPGLAGVEPNMPQADDWLEVRQAFAHAGVEVSTHVDFTTLFHLAGRLTPEQKDVIRKTSGPRIVRWLGGLSQLAPTSCSSDIFAVAGLSALRIASIKQPVLALYGEFSAFQATCRYLRTQLAECKAEVIAGAGHLVPTEKPAAFVAVVQEYLAARRGSRKDAGAAIGPLEYNGGNR